MRFPPSLRALNHRDYRLFWTGQLVSLVGTWMQAVGQSWLILQMSSSPFKLGLIGALQFLPTLIFTLFAGAIIDRLPKRKVVVATQTALMVFAFILSALVLSGRVQYWHVAVLAFCFGIANSVDMPARQSFIVELVGKEDLMNAIALNSATFNSARIVGPAVAGFLVAKYGVGLAFMLNGFSFLAVIGALFFIRAEGLPKPRVNKSILLEIREGLQYVMRTPEPAFVLGLLFFVSLFTMNFQLLIPLQATQMLGVDASGFGFLMAAMGVGALIGSFMLAARSSTRPSPNVLITPAAILAATTLIIGFLYNFYAAAAALVVLGTTSIAFTMTCNTLLQVGTPDELRGRVMSLYALVFVGTVPFASFVLGLVTERFGAAAGWWSSGGLGLLAVALLTAWRTMRSRHSAAVVESHTTTTG